ncbi:MAG: DUF3662 domain-containing protein [Anaerolineales bacterium]|nr:DUF3662 domain-containing protein [Anaerolineales bacterium]
MKATLSQVEAQLQRLVEGSLARLFPSEWKNNKLATSLLEAMREHLQTDAIGEEEPSLLAPDLYRIYLPTHQAGERTGNRQLTASLANDLVEATRGSAIRFLHVPVVQMLGDTHLRDGQVRVTAHFQSEQPDETQSFNPPISPHTYAPPLINAFLIYDRTEIFPIEAPVITLGRQWDADLIFDDPRVSRLHAQIRMVDGRFVVFDLGSTGGTFVNGQRVQQRVLFRGDVLSLAGVELIFGQDEDEVEETRPMQKPGFSAEPFS